MDNVPWGAVGVQVQWIMYPGGLWVGGGGYMISTTSRLYIGLTVQLCVFSIIA